MCVCIARSLFLAHSFYCCLCRNCECVCVRACMNEWWWKNKQKFVFTPVTYFRAVTVTIIPIFLFSFSLLFHVVVGIAAAASAAGYYYYSWCLLLYSCGHSLISLILKAISQKFTRTKMRANTTQPKLTIKIQNFNNNNKMVPIWIWILSLSLCLTRRK